jgi:hypothetical protein
MVTRNPLIVSADRLFDAGARIDPSPAEHGEDSFSFMNRVDQPFWERIRAKLERWSAGWISLPRSVAASPTSSEPRRSRSPSACSRT